MRRTSCDPRPNWRDRVASQGLLFYDAPSGPGGASTYWAENACYRLTSAEVDYLETVTEQLHQMSVEAGRFLASGALGSLGLPPGALEVARASLEANAPSLYGRFDFAWDGRGHAKLLEYNADTPTGLLEASVIQWYWLEDTHGDLDQWNSLHERLVQAWRELAWRLPQAPVVFAHHPDSVGPEEEMTVAYLRDTADQAGLRTASLPIDAIGYDEARRCFVGEGTDVLRTCFKLYPWEDMLAEEFGRYVEPVASGPRSTTWIEPPWKVLLSNKALLAALWQLYPGHECLLPAYLDGPRELTDWVAKPLHGREGAGIRVHVGGVDRVPVGGVDRVPVGGAGARYGAEGYCYQQWSPVPSFEGHRPVLGCWVVDGKAAGLGIREGVGDITDDLARFVPHVIEAVRPDEATQAAWLTEPAVHVPGLDRGREAEPEPTAMPLPPQGPPAPPRSPSPEAAPTLPVQPWRPFRVDPTEDAPPADPLSDPGPGEPYRDAPFRDAPYRDDPTRGTF